MQTIDFMTISAQMLTKLQISEQTVRLCYYSKWECKNNKHMHKNKQTII
jgi:hypothetical protein